MRAAVLALIVLAGCAPEIEDGQFLCVDACPPDFECCAGVCQRACGDLDAGDRDGGERRDGGEIDAGPAPDDAGTADAGSSDAGANDAGTSDAGPECSAGCGGTASCLNNMCIPDNLLLPCRPCSETRQCEGDRSCARLGADGFRCLPNLCLERIYQTAMSLEVAEGGLQTVCAPRAGVSCDAVLQEGMICTSTATCPPGSDCAVDGRCRLECSMDVECPTMQTCISDLQCAPP